MANVMNSRRIIMFCNIAFSMVSMQFRKRIFRWSGYLLTILGSVALIMVILAFTRLPFDAHRFLGESNSRYEFTPEVVLMMGGSGMPSSANLMRLWYVAEAAHQYPKAEIILVHVPDSGVSHAMASFLRLMDIDSSRIRFHLKGNSTREQVLELRNSWPSLMRKRLVVITSPDHMYRSLGVFRKVGFKTVGGISAFEVPVFISLDYDHRRLGGRKMVPDVSQHLDLRYNFWNHIKLEIICLREYMAILYYRLNGWI